MIEKYLKQDIFNPEYLFHGSNVELEHITPQQSTDSSNETNVDNAIFLSSWFINAAAYAFSKQLQELNVHYSFDMNNNGSLPAMTYAVDNIPDNLYGYVYVFKKSDDIIKDDHETTTQYRCYHELIPVDKVKVCFNDFKEFFSTKPYILNSPESLNYITDKLDSVLPQKIEQYKKIFKIDNLEPVRINYFDNIDDFRNFIYELRGTKDTLPEYAHGTYDKGMINAYISPDIKIDSEWYKDRLYLPAHELFHILYFKYILGYDYSKRIVWYDEGMAQFLSGEYDYLLDEEKFEEYFNKAKESTKVIPDINTLEHGTSFRNDNYDVYTLSYLSIRYLSEILNEEEFYNLMSNFDKIKEYGNTIIEDMFNYYSDKFNKTK